MSISPCKPGGLPVNEEQARRSGAGSGLAVHASMQDEFLISHVIKFNLLKPIIEAFVENGNRYNMLHSVVLELLEYIRKENIEFLIEYVGESFWDQLVKFERLGSIQAFKLKYQQIMESAETKQSTSVVDMGKRAKERGVDKEEEDYFNDRPKSGGPVDHYDDEDDKYFNPPPKKPVKAYEDDDALIIHMVRSSPDDGRHTDGKARKKPKLEARISCAKIVAAVNVTGRHSDLEDKRTAPLTSMQSSEGYGHLGDGGADGQNQHALENLDCVHQTEEDSTKTGGDLSPTMDVDTTKPTDSEP